ncbi:MAG: hypothetical protein EXS35_02285 [Pedosphaera sp.]|nr:hypothetical protein [Pedosphaera sp.]
MALPLLGGEGRGEGERSHHLSGARRTRNIAACVFAAVFMVCTLVAKEPPPLTNPPPPVITLQDFKLIGNLNGDRASFTLTATANVESPKSGPLELLSGTLALTEVGPHPKWELRAESGRYVAVFDRAGKYPISLKFNVAVKQGGGWSGVDFRVASAAVQPVVLRGLAEDTQFEFAGAARPERKGGDFTSFLPAGGAVKLSWKESRKPEEGKLFYAATMLSQISFSPGLMRQVALVDFKVMQGELNRVTLLLRGAGEVTRVQGDQVLAWNVEPAKDGKNPNDRQLVVQLNQPQKDSFALQVQLQTPLGAFPQTTDAIRLQPEGATRFAGFFRIVNEGAVRLEVTQATGLSQISPEQFPESDATKSALRATGGQRFAYRFSSADYALRIQADQIQPELTVSEVLAYHHGQNELVIDGEIELDVREAPLRELLLRVPKGYAIARLNASGMNDYFLREPADEADAELRIVYGQPVMGRQVVQFRLERNKPLGETNWTLPRVEVVKAKSVRGNVGVSADAGFRLSAERSQALTEIATAFFPRKVTGLQSAFRLSEPGWSATMRVERLPQTVTADGFHLFSIGEGIAYGSSVMNYLISGAPMAAFRVELSEEAFNVEFTGKDIRNWQKTTNGYLVQLHSPVAGAFTLLATYERPFKSQGETLAFTGARPLDAQSESGHTLVISAYQFQVKPVDVSPSLLPLETGEVPAEYRLFFDAPLLAAYRYTSRPFNLKLALSPLAQGKSLDQVVDRASLVTRISKEGQVLMDASYLVKNRGNPNFKLTLPAGMELWSATVNGESVVPVKDGSANLIPLPQRADPNAVLKLDLKLAAKSASATRVTITAPKVDAPVMLAEWRIEPDAGQRLAYLTGSLTPVGGVPDVSGFAQLARMFSGDDAGRIVGAVVMPLVLLLAGLIVWRWAGVEGVGRFSARHVVGTLLGLVAITVAIFASAQLVNLAGRGSGFAPGDVTMLAPVQQPGSELKVEVANVAESATGLGVSGFALPVLLALVLWIYGWLGAADSLKPVCRVAGWMLLAWAALRSMNGAPLFFGVLAAFLLLHVLLPALRGIWSVPRKPLTENGITPAVASILLVGLFWSACEGHAASQNPNGIPALSLGLRGTSYPGNSSAKEFNPNGVASESATTRYNPVGVEKSNHPPTKGSSSLATLGWKTQSLRDSEPAAPRVLLLAQNEPNVAGSSAGSRSKTRDAADSKSALQVSAVPESITQQIRIEEEFALATAKIRWVAVKGQTLPLLVEPAVMTQLNYSSNALKLVQTVVGGKRTQQLIAQRDGTFDLELKYQLQVTKWPTESVMNLPTTCGLINQLSVTIAGQDVDVLSPHAVSIQRELAGSNTVAALVLSPVNDAWFRWKPRSRDVKHEKAVFYVEVSQLYVPSAGVIEGAHLVAIRPAQGELSELILDVPRGATITDVSSSRREEAQTGGQKSEVRGQKSEQLVSLWRFDPDARKLRVTFSRAQSRSFTLLVRSQVATGMLPFEQSVGLLSVEGAANQIGVLGVATGNEVQLDTVTTEIFSPINLEDFPGEVAQSLAAQIPGLTVRRAFRYSDAKATASLKASPVEPDVRVDLQNTLSLGEDRTVLAANATVDITRAGIFRLSFVLPPGFDVESISGAALSHWTELKTDAGRVITLNLKGKTEGRQQFAISLAGPGTKAASAWTVPQLVLREAGKQQGTLLVVPEQGMQLQSATVEGLSQLDPQRSGVRQKGVLAFRVLQTPWNLALKIEQVDPWIQVTSLQHATVTEAQVKIAANLQYQIENTGLKLFRVWLPTNAESVRFNGQYFSDSDFQAVAGAVTNDLQKWEVKLQRRVIGQFLLQVNYQTPIANQAAETAVRGVQAADVNLQRGFVTVQAGGRLQVRVEALPATLQPTEWQSIPRALQQNLQAVSANFAYRLVEPGFELPLKLDRHEAAKLLAARVQNITFTSVISDDGVMLTQVRLEMQPGDKRLLHLTLPADAKFWFAFVNQNGVWPWREGDKILIPLEKQSRTDKPVPVEFFYSSKIGKTGARSLDLQLLAPKFDLPLENISWRVFLNEKWRVANTSGTMQLQDEQHVARPASVDVQSYLQNESLLQREKTKEAEEMLAMGNSWLEKGDPQQARRAFQSAYGLSTHDNAFNEDARVQLHNLKLQQALVGLNVRQAATAGDTGALGGRFRDLRGAKDLNYTQQDAKQIIDRNSADENTAYMRLAEKLIQQQDAAVTTAAAIRANIPQQGRVLTFQRSVAVDKEADLHIGLEARAVQAASSGVRILILLATLVVLGAFGWAGRALRQESAAV